MFSVFFCVLGVHIHAWDALDDAIGQMLMPYVEAHQADSMTKDFLARHRPGGIILYRHSNRLSSATQVQALCADLQEQARELGLGLLLIAADQEGGLVTRLRDGMTEFPGNAALGRNPSYERAYRSALVIGAESRQQGVNVVLAPVADVNVNPENPIIGIRAYASDPESECALAGAALAGFEDAGVLACMKHFPGHGDVSVDSHDALPTVLKPREELDRVELHPFRQLIDQAPGIMSAHLMLPALDPDHCATTSKAILTTLLREDWGYEGLLFSDSLTMEGVLRACGSIEEAAVQAALAGCDILIIGGRTLEGDSSFLHDHELSMIHQALRQAVESGRLPLQRICEAQERIAHARRWLEEAKPIRLSSGAHELAELIAEDALRADFSGLDAGFFNQPVWIVAPTLLKEVVEQSGLDTLAVSTQGHYFPEQEPSGALMDTFKTTGERQNVLFLSYNAWRYPGQLSFLRALCASHNVLCVASRDPRDLDLVKGYVGGVSTVSPTAVSLRAVGRAIRSHCLSDDVAQPGSHSPLKSAADQSSE
jgi:beta-N-acetylhexosaminidase